MTKQAGVKKLNPTDLNAQKTTSQASLEQALCAMKANGSPRQIAAVTVGRNSKMASQSSPDCGPLNHRAESCSIAGCRRATDVRLMESLDRLRGARI